MKRREFITLIGGVARGRSRRDAQQIGTPVIGFLNSGTREGLAPHLPVFLQALNEIGFVEGRNMTVVWEGERTSPGARS